MKALAQAWLALENGETFAGESVGAVGQATGELVFNTAMSGYQEVFSDPSYAGQMVTFTCPHIGNVGFNAADAESAKGGPCGAVFRAAVMGAQQWRQEQSMQAALEARGCVGISGVDTRYITHMLRDQGAMRACIMSGDQADPEAALAAARAAPSLKGQNLASEVSCQQAYDWTEGLWEVDAVPADKGRIVVMDFGVKRRILRHLVSQGFAVHVVPAHTSAQAILKMSPSGVLLSNGPGDPAACTESMQTIQALVDVKVPLMGVCLGYQLLALVLGAQTQKMKFGHHGVNHPVVHLPTQRTLITSQNHGFMVDEASLPKHLEATHRSLFDGSLQGFKHTHLPIMGVQGHPEAGPGPADWSDAFVDWCQSICEVQHA